VERVKLVFLVLSDLLSHEAPPLFLVHEFAGGVSGHRNGGLVRFLNLHVELNHQLISLCFLSESLDHILNYFFVFFTFFVYVKFLSDWFWD